MSVSRRTFLGAVPAALAAQSVPTLNRRDIVSRHNPTLRGIDPRSPLSVGNGEFAFTADPTGLQTFPQPYETQMPLCTQSQWGWHTAPNVTDKGPADLRLTEFDTFGRKVGYPTSSDGQKPLFDWLRENPHRLHLGRIAFAIEKPEEIRFIQQTLDLWTGTLHSEFEWRGQKIAVETCCHPAGDMIAVTVRGRVPVIFEFPYGSGAMNAADWAHPDKHRTRQQEANPNLLNLDRTLDADSYTVSIAWPGIAAAMKQESSHRFVLTPAGDRLAFCCAFQRNGHTTGDPTATFAAAQKHWSAFWTSGAAIDLGAAPTRAPANWSAASCFRSTSPPSSAPARCRRRKPDSPATVGTASSTWRCTTGTPRTSHAWGRAPLLERSLGVVRRDSAFCPRKGQTAGIRRRALAQDDRARWPRQPLAHRPAAHLAAAAPHRHGRADATPHTPIAIPWPATATSSSNPPTSWRAHSPTTTPQSDALCARSAGHPCAGKSPAARNLEPHLRTRILGPTHSASPNAGASAPAWPANPSGTKSAPNSRLSRSKTASTWRTKTARRLSPNAIAITPPCWARSACFPAPKVDRETMRRTLKKVFAEWKWADTWGWDFPMVAMTAASLGEPALAIDALSMDTPKNTWLPNGHNWQRANLPLYLPGNGGLLLAVAHMVRENAFPRNWNVRHEGFLGAIPSVR